MMVGLAMGSECFCLSSLKFWVVKEVIIGIGVVGFLELR
jgi:hypothetical protein